MPMLELCRRQPILKSIVKNLLTLSLAPKKSLVFFESQVFIHNTYLHKNNQHFQDHGFADFLQHRI